MLDEKQLISLEMNFDDYKKVKTLLPDVCPDVSFSLKEKDENLVFLGLAKSAPCIVVFHLNEEEFEEMLTTLNFLEIDAYIDDVPNENSFAFKKYLKYGCLYDILYNAGKI